MESYSQPHVLYLINFGWSIHWRSSSGEHRPFEKDCYYKPRKLLFSSVPCLQGAIPARRDDIESLAYVLIYLLGGLPWSVGEATRAVSDRAVFDRMAIEKSAWSSGELCKHLPREYADFLDYARGLEFHAEPEYDRWCNIFLERELKGEGPSLDQALGQHELFKFFFPYAYTERELLAEWCATVGGTLSLSNPCQNGSY